MLSAQTKLVARSALQTRVAQGYELDGPCDIFELIDKLSLDLKFTSTTTLDGLYLVNGGASAINVSGFRPAGLQRYTTAHELGHHILGHGDKIDGDLEEHKSNSADEEAANAFARHLLMPRRAVLRAFKELGVRLSSLDPIDVFRVAMWLGVGYATLLQQLRWTLRLVSTATYQELLKFRPQEIKQDLVPGVKWEKRKELWPLSSLWSGCRVHAQIGDAITGLSSVSPLVELKGDHVIAAHVGDCIGTLESGGKVQISVSRTDYVGLYKYRYLPEPADD